MAKTRKAAKRTLDARRDVLDFRDRMYRTALVEVPTHVDLEDYKKVGTPILDQGQEGACTGFGLATVANYLLRKRKVIPDNTPVSARMFYEVAKRFDEWPGHSYEGSSARGAMKGWHKYGVCSEEAWPYEVGIEDAKLSGTRIQDALRRPLGGYYRVNHKDIVAMHSALVEAEVLYATCLVHTGWDDVGPDGRIVLSRDVQGGHAFAIVAYDENGFWIQNSWADDWGADGFAQISYDDWLLHGTDVWVARLGAPMVLTTREAVAVTQVQAVGETESYAYGDLRPHIVSIGNEGLLRERGAYGTSPDEVEAIFTEDIPRVTRRWKKKRILLYAHGGLVPEGNAVGRLAEYRTALIGAEVYPLSFIWKSDFWTTLTNIVQDALRRTRPEGPLDAALDFMLDRLDDAIEPIARAVGGRSQWEEMKENAKLATINEEGGARLTLSHLARLVENDRSVEIHIVGHSAGAIFHAPLVQLLTTKGKIGTGRMQGQAGLGIPIKSCTLWAPACTINLFSQSYLTALKAGGINRFGLFTLTDEAERDDHCANVYHKSLLYLVSNAFEERRGTPLLGMAKFVERDAELSALFKRKTAHWVRSPNSAAPGSLDHSTAAQHGGYDDDRPTVLATLARILDRSVSDVRITFRTSESKLRDIRRTLSP